MALNPPVPPSSSTIAATSAISANDLNHYLHIIQQWAYQWKMEFNPDPIKQATEVLFSCKKSSPNHPHGLLNKHGRDARKPRKNNA